MRVSLEMSRFSKDGFIASRRGVKTCPDNVNAIRNFEQPTTLFNISYFFKPASYYRCFFWNFAPIAKPFTNILKGENVKVNAHQPKKKTEVNFYLLNWP